MPEDVTEYHGKVFVDDKTFNDEALLLVDEQRNWFLEMASTLMKMLSRLLSR